jgi:hypothetical protein
MGRVVPVAPPSCTSPFPDVQDRTHTTGGFRARPLTSSGLEGGVSRHSAEGREDIPPRGAGRARVRARWYVPGARGTVRAPATRHRSRAVDWQDGTPPAFDRKHEGPAGAAGPSRRGDGPTEVSGPDWTHPPLDTIGTGGERVREFPRWCYSGERGNLRDGNGSGRDFRQVKLTGPRHAGEVRAGGTCERAHGFVGGGPPRFGKPEPRDLQGRSSRVLLVFRKRPTIARTDS